MIPQFVIFVETTTGQIIRAFTWSRDEASAIARARRDCVEFGHGSPARVWAERVVVTNQ